MCLRGVVPFKNRLECHLDFSRAEKKKSFQSFYESSVTLLSKLDRQQTQKEKYSWLMNECEVFSQTWAQEPHGA